MRNASQLLKLSLVLPQRVEGLPLQVVMPLERDALSEEEEHPMILNQMCGNDSTLVSD
jgi:hypothetical protein